MADDRARAVESPLLASTNSSTPNYGSIDDSERGDGAEVLGKLAPNDPDADVLPETSVIGRSLTWQSAYMLTISRVLGSGIFATPGVVLASAGSPGLALTLWLAGAVLAYLGLQVSLEYGCMLPRSGGEKVYLEFTYRRPKYLATVLVATQAIILGFSAANCIVFAQYTLFAFGIEGTELLRKLIATALITVITIIHACFVQTGIRIQNFLGWVKIALILCMILSGLFVIFLRPREDTSDAASAHLIPTMHDASPWSDLWSGSIWEIGSLATATFQVSYSYIGLSNLNMVLNEVKNPVRTLKTSSLSALATVCVMYILVNVAYFIVVPLEEARTSGQLIAGLYFERVFGVGVGRRILPIMVALCGVGNVMVVTFALARLNQEIARSGLIPYAKLLASTKPFGSPLGGLLLHWAPSVLVIVVPTGDIYTFIVQVEAYPATLFALAICIGLLLLRYRRPDLERPYKAWIPGVLIRVLVSLALAVAPWVPTAEQRRAGQYIPVYPIVGLVIMLFGVLYWYVWTIVLPKWRGYKLVDGTEVLSDGTAVATLKRVPRDQDP